MIMATTRHSSAVPATTPRSERGDCRTPTSTSDPRPDAAPADQAESTYAGLPLISWMARFLASQNQDETEMAYKTLCQFGEAVVAHAVAAISVADVSKHARLVWCIAHAGKNSIPALTELLEHASSTVRATTCRGISEAVSIVCDTPADSALAQVQPTTTAADTLDPRVITALLTRLKDDDPKVRALAVATLAEIECPEEWRHDVFHAIVGVMNDSHFIVRHMAVGELRRSVLTGQITAIDRLDFARLRRATRDKAWQVRQDAERALCRLKESGAIDNILGGESPGL
jgi:HEAT repeat protein